MTDELLDQYDVISARHDYLTGCFALYKNNLYINSLFTHSKDFMKVFTSENNYFFDETNFAFKAFEKGCRFDGWYEMFDFNKWMEAFSETSTDPDFFSRRQR